MPCQSSRLEPLCIFGGFRMAYHCWTRSEDGWECDYEYEGLPSTVYPTADACWSAINARFPVQADRIAA